MTVSCISLIFVAFISIASGPGSSSSGRLGSSSIQLNKSLTRLNGSHQTFTTITRSITGLSALQQSSRPLSTHLVASSSQSNDSYPPLTAIPGFIPSGKSAGPIVQPIGIPTNIAVSSATAYNTGASSKASSPPPHQPDFLLLAPAPHSSKIIGYQHGNSANTQILLNPNGVVQKATTLTYRPPSPPPPYNISDTYNTVIAKTVGDGGYSYKSSAVDAIESHQGMCLRYPWICCVCTDRQ